MTHWHIVSIDPERGVIGILKYENAPQSINDYVDMVFQLFNQVLDEEDRTTYLNGMLNIAENDSGYKVTANSTKFDLMWSDCNDDPCSFAIYN